MAKKGRPAGVKNDRGLYTVAIPKEIYDQIDDLAIGSGRSRTAIATFVFTKGLGHIQIVEETITRKRIVDIEQVGTNGWVAELRHLREKLDERKNHCGNSGILK